MATYNGEKYLAEQVDSILEQLSPGDEFLILDDCSKDSTVKILEQYQDSRIKIFINKTNKNHVYSFARVISLASNEIVLMADQDDIWINGRLDLMKNKLIKSKKVLLTTNTDFIDDKGKKIDFNLDGVSSQNSNKFNKNILDIFLGKSNYYGCAMAFRKQFCEIILPIPDYVESHDLWIAIAGNLLKSNIHLDEKTLLRRIHGNNASIINRILIKKFFSRLIFLRSIIELKIRIKKVKLSI